MANRLRQPQSTTDKNAALLRELLKRPENRVCADCHVATHPRWASWSLGVFICIRCSGIHRGMGTHISRVKSADLDAWTDQQTAMMVNWGNRRANRYWEASLPPSHVPSDSKMENFIRTKYSSKRWVLSPTPPTDPATLDDVDDQDSLPLSVVKQSLKHPQPTPPQPLQKQQPNLLGSDTPPPSRQETPVIRTDSSSPKPRTRNDRVTNSSLMGLEFTSPVRTESAQTLQATTTSTAPTSRNDLKNSILKLYAPKPATTSNATTSNTSVSTSPLSSNTMGLQTSAQTGSTGALGDLNSAFSSLTFTPTNPPLQPSSNTFPLSFGQTNNPPKKVEPKPLSKTTDSSNSNWTSSFHLSKPTTTTTVVPPKSGIQLLSTITPITSTQAPQTQSSISSFSNPWESTHTTKTKSAGITTDPWSSTDGKNNGESPSLNTFSSFPIKTTLVSTSHGSGFSSFTGVSSDNRTLPETERTWNDESTEKKFDDDGFGLFETADVWK